MAGLTSLLGLTAVLVSNVFFPHLWCARLCPLGGLQLLAWDLRGALRRAATPRSGQPAFAADQKNRIFIGTADVRLNDCLVVKGRECDRCVASCDYDAIVIGGGTFEPEPEVDAARCVGCGACAAVCPPAVIAIHRPRAPGPGRPPAEPADGASAGF